MTAKKDVPEMPAAVPSYDRSFLVSAAVFLLSVIAAAGWHEPWLLIIPFAWLLSPLVFEYLITHTAQLFWWLLALLPLSTELNITPQLGMDFPDELLLILLTAMTLVKCFHEPQWIPASLLRHPLFFVLMSYMAWILITCVYAAEPALSFKYLLAKTWYIIPFVVLPQVLLSSKTQLQKMALCLLIPMLAVTAITLTRHAFYGFSFEDIKHVMGPFFRNHVNYSSMLVCLLPVGWCVWKLTPANHPKRKWILYGLYTGLAGLVFAYSRGAWIALLAGIAAVWVIRRKLMAIAVVLMILGITISAAWLVTDENFMRFAPDHDHTVFHTDFGEHMLATVNMKDVSTAERFYRWIAGVKMLADKPVTGFGPNAFYLHYKPYTVNRFQTWVSDNPEHSTVHNYFILVALEQGIIGLVLFCVLFFWMLLRLQTLYHRFQSRFYRAVTITAGMVLVMIGVINTMSDMIETDKIGSLFWLCLGLTILLDRKSAEERELVA